MGNLPVLQADATVSLGAPEVARAAWDSSLGKGVLIVAPARPLAPLEQLTVRVLVNGVAQVNIDVEVVRLEPERAMLRVLQGPVPVPLALLAPAPAPPANPFAPVSVARIAGHNPFAPLPSSASSTGALPVIMPAPGEDLSSAMPPPVAPRQPSAADPAPAPAKTPSQRLVATADATPPAPAPSVVAPPASALSVVAAPQAPTTPSQRIVARPDAPPPTPAPSVVAAPPAPTPSVFAAPPAPTPSVVAAPPAPTPSQRVAAAPPAPATPSVVAASPAPTPSQRVVATPDAPPAAPATPSPQVASSPAPPAPAPPVPPAPSQRFTVTQNIAAPPSAVASTIAPLPAASATQAVPATTGATLANAPVPRAALPPYFSDGTLRFASLEDVRAARGDMVSVGAVMATSDRPPPPLAVEVKLAVSVTETRARAKAMIMPAAPGTVVVQAERKDDWRALLDELDPPTTLVSAATGAPARPSVQLNLPKRGSLTNPVTSQGIMALPCHRAVTETDLRSPSVPLLLRWLRSTKGIFRLELVAEGQPVHTLIIVDGREVRSPVSLPTLGKAMAHHAFNYELTELPRAPNLTNTGRTLHLIVEVVRGLLAPHDPDEIASVFPHANDPRPVRAVGSVADALGFSGPLARIVKTNMQGDETVRAVSRAAAGSRSAWDVLVCLELFDGLAFIEGATAKSASETRAPSVKLATKPAILEKDLFAVLGLHWSCSPGEITEAYQKTKREYGGSGLKAPKDKRVADEVMAKIDEAYRTLGSAASRQAYRQKTFNMVWPHQAHLLVQQAKLAVYRKDYVEAKNLLTAAQDMSPSPEAAHMLEALSRSA